KQTRKRQQDSIIFTLMQQISNREPKNLLLRNLNLASLNVVRDVLRAAAVDLASNRESSTKDLLDGALKLTRQRLGPHGASDLNDLVERDGLGVLDVLLLLA